MDYRTGKCSQCGAEFKVPASFAHDVARCKVCQGVVRFEPAVPAPAAPAAGSASGGPEEITKPDADRKRKEHGTLARLRAERAAAAGQAAPSAGPAPAASLPPDDPFALDVGDLGGESLGPIEEEPAPEAVAAPQAAAAAPEDAPTVTPARRGSGARSSRPPRGGRKARGGGRAKRERPQKKKSAMPLLAGVGLLAIAAGGVFFFKDTLFGGGEEANEVAAAETVAPEPEPDVVEEVAAEPEPEIEEVPAEAEAPAEPPAPKVADPASVDLGAIADFGPARETTDEQWTQMNAWMATFMDLDAGAAGPRAGRKLEEHGRIAVPVILNRMKTLDFGSEAGYRAGDMCQKSLQGIFNGRNLSWRYATTPDEHLFNKKVVRDWCKIWGKVIEDIEKWIEFAKLEEKDPEEAERLRAAFGTSDEDGGMGGEDLDDLDVD